ncbi:uncharacterized protein BJ171DRAFT_595608 [Polychytrium aggregatum]|uniref:uncharacterized protein n=1 Tax=Polychytrium aggregatum TaxID=110093 RepID=UPI0022FF3AC6|nr:uncharacterized protein BJ171DRAFT_595608 [Polychytrium aggregatum]KAI9208449.1 hypothetical protein BJ171DRAFT_595608 [Polychytrium aggregatum]
MDDLLNSFCTRINELKQLSLLRTPEPLVPTGSIRSSQTQLSLLMAELEKNIEATFVLLTEEKRLLQTEGLRMLQELDDQNLVLEHMLANMPRHLPAAPAAPTISARSTLPRMASAPQLRFAIDHMGPSGTSSGQDEPTSPDQDKASSAQAVKKTSKGPPQLPPITVAEFQGIPKYVVNRFTRDKLNDAITEFNKAIIEKQTMVRLPQGQMTKEQRDRFWEHKQLVTEELKGKVFLTEKDLRENWSGCGFRLDPLGRSLLASLRHLGYVKEVRGGGHTRYVVLI